MPRKKKTGSESPEQQPTESEDMAADERIVKTTQPSDASVLKQIVEKEMKMSMDDYTAFKSETIEWGKEPQSTNGMKVGQVVAAEVSWRLNTDRRDRATNGEVAATYPTQNYLGLLLWMSNVKNKWVSTPKNIPKLQ